jgi:hypothetical protein
MDDVVTDCITPLGFIGHITFRYWAPDDLRNPSKDWLIVAYPAANTIRGPHAHDGATYITGFYFDVYLLIEEFTEIHEIQWRSPVIASGSLDGPELTVRGVYQGQSVQLRFFHLPPPDEAPGYAVNPATDEVQRIS